MSEPEIPWWANQLGAKSIRIEELEAEVERLRGALATSTVALDNACYELATVSAQTLDHARTRAGELRKRLAIAAAALTGADK